MATWRRLAIEAFPDLRAELNDPQFSIYVLFGELLCKLESAHAENDIDAQNRIYHYATWCARQKTENLWNASAVSFFERVFDGPLWKYRERVVAWLAPDILNTHRSLWVAYLSSDRIQEIDQLVASRKKRLYEQW